MLVCLCALACAMVQVVVSEVGMAGMMGACVLQGGRTVYPVLAARWFSLLVMVTVIVVDGSVH